jgi:hypothetical protein
VKAIAGCTHGPHAPPCMHAPSPHTPLPPRGPSPFSGFSLASPPKPCWRGATCGSLVAGTPHSRCARPAAPSMPLGASGQPPVPRWLPHGQHTPALEGLLQTPALSRPASWAFLNPSSNPNPATWQKNARLRALTPSWTMCGGSTPKTGLGPKWRRRCCRQLQSTGGSGLLHFRASAHFCQATSGSFRHACSSRRPARGQGRPCAHAAPAPRPALACRATPLAAASRDSRRPPSGPSSTSTPTAAQTISAHLTRPCRRCGSRR